MVQKTNQHRVIAEPGVLQSIIHYGRNHNWIFSRDNKDLVQLLRYVMILFIRNTDITYFVKPRSAFMLIGQCLREALPEVKEVFMYRALKPTLTSFRNAFGSKYGDLPLPKNVLSVTVNTFLGGDLGPYIDDQSSYQYVRGYILVFGMARFKSKFGRMPCFCYEDLLRDKEKFCKKIFEVLDIPEQYVEIGLTALERDSQQNTKLSRTEVSKQNPPITESCLDWCKKIGVELGIEIDGDDFQFLNFN